MPAQLVSRRRQRLSFSRIKDIEEVPNLLDIQKQSYEWFISKGLTDTYREISPVEAFTHNLVLEFMSHRFEPPTYSVEECKRRDVTYSSRLHIDVKLVNKNTSEIVTQEVFVGDFPVMTDRGTFIINGTERVIVTQLVRSPGVYFGDENKDGVNIFNASIIPNRGAWFELDASSLRGIGVKLDRNHKFPVTVLLRALGYSSDEDILQLFNNDELIQTTIKRDPSKNREEALVEIYKTMRPDDFTSMQGAKELSKKSIDPDEKAKIVSEIAPYGQTVLEQLYFQDKKYDLAEVGRYKVNKKLNIWERLIDRTLTRDIRLPGEIDKETGEIKEGDVLVPAGTLIDRRKAQELKKDARAKHISEAWIQSPDGSGKELKVQGNGFIPEDKKIVTPDDMVSTVNYLINLHYGIGGTDDIDHLGNRRLKTVGELLQNQFRIGLSRMERLIRERMTLQDVEVVMPQTLINFRPVVAALKEFFGSSQLSQFMDQTNPLAELTHKRRLSALGPGGLNREHAGFEVRDVHHSHYGRICPIETPEGPNIGLIGALCNYSKINPYGFIQTPYMRVLDGKVTGEIEYLTADEEDIYIIAQANEQLDDEGKFVRNRVEARYKDKIIVSDVAQVDYIDVSPKQIVSIATALIPFLEHDDAGRALMGANMQRQAVPLIKAEAPLVGTGMEYRAAVDSGIVVTSSREGQVVRVDAQDIVMQYDDGEEEHYPLMKYKRSNQGTCINQKPVVRLGDRVAKGEVIADGPATDMGEMALGRNVLIAFLPWEGYNYEDAILLSEKLVKDDVFTSIHIEEYECEARQTKLGDEEITRDIPNQGEEALKDLDVEGIIRVGAEVRAGDILVGKVTPKGETELTPEEKLLRAIFGEKAR
ncbi:MAG TPA: DNA-directed RNA polymerase subunit beta, partial [Bacillota bacterium]|nr:DNA-directed RNA polymerase subunit beta [Bacillota bacterium]